jgi:hypothetical protein
MRAAGLLVALVGLVAVTGAQAPKLETLPVRGQVSLISSGEVNVLVQIGPQVCSSSTRWRSRWPIR